MRTRNDTVLGVLLALGLSPGAAFAQGAEPQPAEAVPAEAVPAEAVPTPAEPARSGAAKTDAARSEARALGLSGIQAYQEGDFAAATTQLEESFRLLKIPTLGLWSARALVQTGLLLEAAERYRLVPGLPVDVGDIEKQRAAQNAAEFERVQLLPRIPTLTIRVVGAKLEDTRVLLDGADVSVQRLSEGLPLNPGRHEVTGQVGQERSTHTLALLERQREEITLRFNPNAVSPAAVNTAVLNTAVLNTAALNTAAASPAAGNPALPSGVASLPPLAPSEQDERRRIWRTAGWISLGVGGAGLATGVVTYLIGKPKRDDIDGNAACRNGVCGPAAKAQVDSYNPIATVNLVALVTGAVFGAAGATVLILTPPTGREVALQVGPGSLGVQARF